MTIQKWSKVAPIPQWHWTSVSYLRFRTNFSQEKTIKALVVAPKMERTPDVNQGMIFHNQGGWVSRERGNNALSLFPLMSRRSDGARECVKWRDADDQAAREAKAQRRIGRMIVCRLEKRAKWGEPDSQRRRESVWNEERQTSKGWARGDEEWYVHPRRGIDFKKWVRRFCFGSSVPNKQTGKNEQF